MCTRGAREVHASCTRGARKLHARCTRGVREVHARCTRGACEVHARITVQLTLKIQLPLSCSLGVWPRPPRVYLHIARTPRVHLARTSHLAHSSRAPHSHLASTSLAPRAPRAHLSCLMQDEWSETRISRAQCLTKKPTCLSSSMSRARRYAYLLLHREDAHCKWSTWHASPAESEPPSNGGVGCWV